MFVNDFSWSKSRHDVFKSCQRKYYYHYYGSWNGWSWEADKRTQQLYLLKKLQSRAMWLGSLVHLKIEELLKAYRQSGPAQGTVEEWREALLATMRREFVGSRAGWPARKKWRLWEHEYQIDVSKAEWKEAADQAVHCLETFWRSEIHQRARALSEDQWLEIEDFSSFQLDGVKVHVVLDFSFRADESFYIYDWKTGRSEEPMNELQLACYQIYAQEKWQATRAQTQALEFNLFHDKVVNHAESGLDLEEAKARMLDSMNQMRALLSDVGGNVAKDEAEFALTENDSQCEHCVFRKACARFQQ